MAVQLKRHLGRPNLLGVFRLHFLIGLTGGALVLIVVLALIGIPSSASGATSTSTFSVVADTFIKNRSPHKNYGGYSTVQADNYPKVKRILLRFHIENLPDGAVVSSAILRMFVVDASTRAGTVNTVGGPWSETTVTWSNAPAVGGVISSFSTPAILGTWREADVTPAVTGNGYVDFYVVTQSNNGVDYLSKEGGANSPTLTVQWSKEGVSSTPTGSFAPDPTGTSTATPAPTPTPTAAPTPAPSGDPVLVGAGDISSCSSSGDEATAALLDAIPGTVFTAGDDVYDSGTATEFANCYDPTWGRHKARTRPAPGNHEYSTAGAAGYFNYFRTAAGDPSKGYYSYDLGAWHIVVLNSNCSAIGGCGAGSAQETWLRADLAAHPATCTAAIWHHPLFSSGQHGNNAGVKPLYQALYDYGAEVVLNGHDHLYERFAPQDPNGVADARGIREFVVGMGGKDHYSWGSIKPNSEARDNTSWGVLKLTLHPTSYDWQFVPVAGKTFTDSGSASCVPNTSTAVSPTSAEQLINQLEDVAGATAYRYGARDDKGGTMDTLKIIGVPGQAYLGVYHTLVGGVFYVRVATSSDLLNWTWKVDLDAHASQPTIARLSNGAYLVAYEMDSPSGNWVRFRYYQDLSSLLQGIAQRTFDAGRKLSACAEGTPNIYSAALSPDIFHSTIDVGFHYFWNCNVDRQARGTLTNFSSWSVQAETHLNDLFEASTPRIGGNFGDRDYMVFSEKRFNIHEAQYTKGDWSSWRNYLYDYEADRVVWLNVRTHNGSTAFGNPTFTAVTSPAGRPAVVATYFLFSEGAAKGEGGELIFYKEY